MATKKSAGGLFDEVGPRDALLAPRNRKAVIALIEASPAYLYIAKTEQFSGHMEHLKTVFIRDEDIGECAREIVEDSYLAALAESSGLLSRATESTFAFGDYAIKCCNAGIAPDVVGELFLANHLPANLTGRTGSAVAHVVQARIQASYSDDLDMKSFLANLLDSCALKGAERDAVLVEISSPKKVA